MLCHNPESRRARRRRAGTPAGPPGRDDRRLRSALGRPSAPSCAGRSPPSPAWPACCAPRPAACCASMRPPIAAEERLDGTLPAALLRPRALGRGDRPGLQAALADRARLARHEAGHRPAAGLPPQGGAHPRPRACSAGWPCCSSASPRTPATTPGRTCAASFRRSSLGSFAGTGRQLPPAHRDHAPPSAPSWPSSSSPSRRGSCELAPTAAAS